MLDRLHFGNGRDRALEILKAYAPLGGQFDPQEHRHAEAQFLVVQIETLALDHTRFAQAFDAPPGGRLRQTQLAPQNAGRLRGVPAEFPEDQTVGGVEIGHRGSTSSDLIRATCISASISAICGRVRMLLRYTCWYCAMFRAITERRTSTRPRKVWISTTSGTCRAASMNSSKARGCVLSSVMRSDTSTA